MKKKQLVYSLCSLLIVTVCSVALSSFILNEKGKESVKANHQPTLSGVIKEKPVENTSGVVVKIDSLVKITSTSAICYYSVKVFITGDDKVKITETGANVVKIGSIGSKNFLGRASAGSNYKAPISGLTPGGKYTLRAYATSNKGTDYSTQKSFETKLN